MNDVIQFPNLFTEALSVNRVAFSVMGFDIYWYGLLITVGACLAVTYGLKRAPRFGVIPDNLFDTVFVGGVAGIIGARSYYVLFINLNPAIPYNYTLKDAVLGIRDGGLAIYGGIILSVTAVVVYTKIRKIPLAPTLDLTGLGFLIGQSIGRWGNFFNQEAYGDITAADYIFGMTGGKISHELSRISLPAESLVHPCFLYESVWCALGFILLHFYSKKLRTFDGEVFLLYVIWYGAGRSFIEGLRLDSLYAGELRVSQWLAGISAAISVVIFAVVKIRIKSLPKYRMACDDAECMRRILNYNRNLNIDKEKKAAVKALRKAMAEPQAPSILTGEAEKADNSD